MWPSLVHAKVTTAIWVVTFSSWHWIDCCQINVAAAAAAAQGWTSTERNEMCSLVIDSSTVALYSQQLHGFELVWCYLQWATSDPLSPPHFKPHIHSRKPRRLISLNLALLKNSLAWNAVIALINFPLAAVSVCDYRFTFVLVSLCAQTDDGMEQFCHLTPENVAFLIFPNDFLCIMSRITFSLP